MAPHTLVLRPADEPIAIEGHTLRPYVFVVTRGTLRITKGPDDWTVGEGMVIGLELLTIPDETPPPFARFTARADSKACMLAMIRRNEAKSSAADDPGTWIARAILTTQTLTSKMRVRRSAPNSHQDGSYVETLQRALATSERKSRIFLHLAETIWRLIREHNDLHTDIGQAVGILCRILLGEHAEKDPIAEHLKDYLSATVVPRLLPHDDTADVAEALRCLAHVLPGRIRKHSGICPVAQSRTEDEDDRETPRDGKPAFKAR